MSKIELDVGFVNPQASGHLQSAARETLGAAKAYTQHKRDREDTDSLCLAAGVDYQPLVWETTGGLCKEAEETVKSLNRLVAVNTNTPLSEVAQRFWRRTSVDLQKANHRAFTKRVAAHHEEADVHSASLKFLR